MMAVGGLLGLGAWQAGATGAANGPVRAEPGPDAVLVEISGNIAGVHRNLVEEALERARQAQLPVMIGLDTPGGSMEDTLAIMEALADYPGETVAYVREALGAGAFVALAADEIVMHPKGIIGSAGVPADAAQDESGEATGRHSSYIRAKLRQFSADAPYRMQAARAMTEPGYVLEMEGETLKAGGDLLTLTAEEAARSFSEGPLLAAAIAPGAGDYLARRFEDGERFALLRYAKGQEAPRKVRYEAFRNEDGEPLAQLLEGGTRQPAATEAVAADEDPAGVDAPAGSGQAAGAAGGGPVQVYVVPIEGPIDSPQLYILRRALKQAIENEVDAIVLKMNTPGGRLDITLEMMDALDRFEGKTMTYVEEAISAGSFISIATEDIYFSPSGIMGAAAAVSGGGQEIPETMRQKINSYLDAKVRALAGEYRYRPMVQRAMFDADYELEIDGEVIKPPGELLTLTAEEAASKYGYPPAALLAQGIAPDIEAMLDAVYGQDSYTVRNFEVTWVEEFAKWFRSIAPLLLGAGLLLIYFEIQTPGFGVFGIGGVVCLLLFFASNYVAALSGYESVILFFLGVLLIIMEVFIFPGTFILGLSGAALVLGSAIWAMADYWPDQGLDLSWQMFQEPVINLILGLAITIVGVIVFARFLPRSWFWDRIILSTTVGQSGDSDAVAGGQTHPGLEADLPDLGSEGTAVTNLFPSGVEIAGKRYQARVNQGMLERGASIRVVAYRDFVLLVEEA